MNEIPQEYLTLSDKEIAKRLGISKQYVSMLRKIMRGTCVRCQEPAAPGARECLKHARKRQRQARKRMGHKPWKPGSRGRPPAAFSDGISA